MNATELLRIESDGWAWVEKSLREGFVLSSPTRFAPTLKDGSVRAIVPAGFGSDHHDLGIGGVISPELATRGLISFFEEVTEGPGSCLVIEDDVARSSDPRLADMSVPSSFIGERVLHWVDLQAASGSRAAAAVGEGSTGYPLNAFLSSESAVGLGLFAGAPAPADLPSRLASSLVAIIVSAFDAESFAILSPR